LNCSNLAHDRLENRADELSHPHRIDLASVRKLINPELEQPISYTSYKYFVMNDPELKDAWRTQRA
jgi:hypothetical protein